MKNTTRYGLMGFVVGIALTWVAAALVVNTQNTGMMQFMGMGMHSRRMMNGSGTLNDWNARSRGMDAHFIEAMIPHHEDAIFMAKLALEEAEHEEIRELARDIIEAQGKEIEDMQKWYLDWFDSEVPENAHHGMMQMGMMGNDADIQAITNAASFDKAFIEAMIPHHQMAVMMAQMLERSTDRPEMQQLARNIIESQNREIEAMRKWYVSWYSNAAQQ